MDFKKRGKNMLKVERILIDMMLIMMGMKE